MGYSYPLNVTDTPGSGYDRLRVDVGQTGFFVGREFRNYVEFSLPIGNTLYYRFVSPIDFILQTQLLAVDAGGVRLSVWIGNVTPAGVWTNLPVIGKNRMSTIRQPAYVSQCQVQIGGTFTGGTEVDVIRVRCASQSVSAQTVGSSQDDERGLPAGTYYIKIEPLTGVNDTSTGIYQIAWEERP